MLDKIWNGKYSGTLSCLILLISVLYSKIKSFITTKLFILNIAKCGDRVKIHFGIVYRYPQKIEIGNDVIIGNNVNLCPEHLHDNSLIIEEGVSIGDRCFIDFSGGVRIHKSVHIAHDVLITTHDHGYNYHDVPIGKTLEIQENAFIGNRAIILFNCYYIGKNSVIGAGSVVTKNVPDNCIVAGNPARIIKRI